MSEPDTQVEPGRRGRGWIVATVVCAIAAIGLGAWALSLRSDNEDKDAQIAAQQKQLDEREGVAGQVREAASGIAEDAQQAMRELGDQLDEIQGTATATQEEAQAAIERAESAAADAKDRLDAAAGDQLDKARAQADEASARADAAAACARGYLSAIGGAFDAGSIGEGVDQARSDIQALQGSCAETLGG
jgi:uncharacterized membrane protein YdfJ with MMPL/SSD domain